MELPPRARRIQPACCARSIVQGTTSACAENTDLSDWVDNVSRNYLRVRGEYTAGVKTASFSQELPPRARRILVAAHLLLVARGTTSACAENTWYFLCGCGGYWNYLRVRGEYPPFFCAPNSKKELPPRARRIQPGGQQNSCPGGTTSACAENTGGCSRCSTANWNYLRVRGEYGLI